MGDLHTDVKYEVGANSHCDFYTCCRVNYNFTFNKIKFFQLKIYIIIYENNREIQESLKLKKIKLSIGDLLEIVIFLPEPLINSLTF